MGKERIDINVGCAKTVRNFFIGLALVVIVITFASLVLMAALFYL